MSGPRAAELTQGIDKVRRQAYALADLLGPEMEPVQQNEKRPALTDDVRVYRTKLRTALNDLLRSLTGVRAFYIDVGVDHPVDVTVLDLQLPTTEGRPRQVFSADEKVIVTAVVQATGKDVSTMLHLHVGKKTLEKALDIKAGKQETVPFEVNCRELGLGEHSAELKVVTDDLLPGNNSRYVTFAVRRPRRILVLTDKAAQAEYFAWVLDYWEGFDPDIALAANPPPAEKLLDYEAVYLLGVAKPGAALWTSLLEYARRGGGVGVIPGGEEMDREAYNQDVAQKVLPGRYQYIVPQDDTPAVWDLEPDTIFQHSLLRPFLDWKKRKNDPVDFLLHPRWAMKYWDVRPQANEMVLVSYADDKKRPALLERTLLPVPRATAGPRRVRVDVHDDIRPAPARLEQLPRKGDLLLPRSARPVHGLPGREPGRRPAQLPFGPGRSGGPPALVGTFPGVSAGAARTCSNRSVPATRPTAWCSGRRSFRATIPCRPCRRTTTGSRPISASMCPRKKPI